MGNKGMRSFSRFPARIITIRFNPSPFLDPFVLYLKLEFEAWTDPAAQRHSGEVERPVLK